MDAASHWQKIPLGSFFLSLKVIWENHIAPPIGIHSEWKHKKSRALIYSNLLACSHSLPYPYPRILSQVPITSTYEKKNTKQKPG